MMPSAQGVGRPRDSTEFLETSILEAVVPFDHSIDLQNVIHAWDGETQDQKSTLLPCIEQRQSLFLVVVVKAQHLTHLQDADEILPVYVVLRTPHLDGGALNQYLPRLLINVELYATGIHVVTDGRQPALAEQTKELLSSASIQAQTEPDLVIPKRPSEADAESGHYVYTFWKVEVPVRRPKTKLQKLALYFAVSATLQPLPQDREQSDAADDEYLPSEVPAPINLLEAFSNDPSLGGVRPYLSADRITKVAPSSQISRKLQRPLQSSFRRLFGTAPAIIWRVRLSRLKISPKTPIVIASIDLEVTSFVGCNVLIENVDTSLAGGDVVSYRDHPATKLPKICKPGDQLTFLYRLSPSPSFYILPSDKPGLLYLEVRVHAKALLAHSCTPKIELQWKTNVDFSVSSRPGSADIRRSSKALTATGQPRAQGPDALLTTDVTHREGSSADDLGINITISGPPQTFVGEIFRWSVFVVNRSNKARKLALMAISKPPGNLPSRHRSKPSVSSSTERKTHTEEEGVAEAVLEEDAVYAMQEEATMKPTDIVCLSTDARIGPLATGACYSTELRFLALAPGVLHLDALRVVDLATQAATDIQHLPDIVAIERESEDVLDGRTLEKGKYW